MILIAYDSQMIQKIADMEKDGHVAWVPIPKGETEYALYHLALEYGHLLKEIKHQPVPVTQVPKTREDIVAIRRYQKDKEELKRDRDDVIERMQIQLRRLAEEEAMANGNI